MVQPSDIVVELVDGGRGWLGRVEGLGESGFVECSHTRGQSLTESYIP